MTRFLASLALATLLLAGGWLYAEEPPHREFVRGLRERHYPDLALEYLEKLGKNPSPDVAKWLPLELAETRLELAREETDAGRKTALFAKARAEFEAFIKGNAGDPKAAEANLELARLVSMEAKAQLGSALRQEAPADRKAGVDKARAQFEEAAKRLQDAATQIDAQLAKLENAATPQEKEAKDDLTRARLQAELELGLAQFDQVRTYEEGDPIKRGEVVKKAADVFDKLGARDENHPICWEARAWRGRCYQEIDNAPKALETYNKILAETNPAADSGKRLARYFRLLVLDQDPKYKRDPAAGTAEVIAEAERWRQAYPSYLNTPEGQGVLYQLAEGYLKQALAIPKAQQGQARAQELYVKAEKLYAELERGESEFSQKARERKLNIIITRPAAASAPSSACPRP